MHKNYLISLFCLLITLLFIPCSDAALSLRENLQKAKTGDFIVAMQNKNYTLLHIYDKTADTLTIEEITVPAARMQRMSSWKEWVKQGAPNHTSWILYTIQSHTGKMSNCFSVSQRSWLDLSQNEAFLPTLLNLNFTYIPLTERRKIGPPPSAGTPDMRKYWQPKMVIDGQVIPNIAFETWRTYWPKDNTPLSGKTIDIYLPEERHLYSTYFPYWLEIRGSLAGKATVHIIDSGSSLISPAPPIPKRNSL